MPGKGTLVPAAALAALMALMPLPVSAAGMPAPSADWAGDFCTRLQGMIDAERARVRADFAQSLVDVVRQVRAERRLEGPPALTPDEAVNVARRLWAKWLPVAPAASVGIDGERDGAWLLAPTAAPDPHDAAEPIRIDRASGEVTWALPDPSEHERLHAEVCGPAPSGGAEVSAAGE